jgi:4-amino-4-deoxy-L-arabinose transferase-like glycosyltransferase
MADSFYYGNWNIFYPGVSWNGPEPNYQGMEFQTVTYIAALLYVIVGQHDWVGRSVAVTFGLWGIFALYQLVRRVWDEKHAIASAAVMALLPGSIFIDRSFLPDPVMVALVVTSFWLLVAYFQTDHLHYLFLASIIGTWGFLTKISGLIVGIPTIYAMLTILGYKRRLHPRKLSTMGIAAVFTLAPVIAYYLWARHLSLTYPPYHIAAKENWLWDGGLAQWLSQNYFLPGLSHHFQVWMWRSPVIVLVLFGLLFPPFREERGQAYKSDQPPMNLSGKTPWLFHWWLLAGIIYYFIGAKELVHNPWNFHIINPAAAALVGHGIIVITSFTTRIARPSAAMLIGAILLFSIGMSGQKGLSYMYYPYAQEAYKLGLALRQMTQSGDLVVTMANAIGDPVAIYYSQRRGWIFPPVGSGKTWTQLPEDDNKAIRLLDGLRAQGAGWLGIVNEHRDDIWKNHPLLAEYIEHTCELKQESPEWVIYRILPPE